MTLVEIHLIRILQKTVHIQLFSKKQNKIWVEEGGDNTPLGLYLNIDFDLKRIILKPSQDWFRLHPGNNVDIKLLQQEANIYNNLIEQYDNFVH